MWSEILKVIEGYTTPWYWTIVISLVIYIVLNRKKQMIKQLGLAIVVYCFTYPIWHILAGNTIRYRFIWCFPVFIIVAMGIVKLLEKNRHIQKQLVLLIALCYVLVFGNNIVKYWKTYTYNDSVLHISQAVAEAAELIENDTDDTNIVVVGEYTFMAQVRIYSPRFCWGYSERKCLSEADSRLGKNASYRVATAIQTGYFEENMDIISDLKELETEYIILHLDNEFLMGYEEFFEIVGETDMYRIYRIHFIQS